MITTTYRSQPDHPGQQSQDRGRAGWAGPPTEGTRLTRTTRLARRHDGNDLRLEYQRLLTVGTAKDGHAAILLAPVPNEMGRLVNAQRSTTSTTAPRHRSSHPPARRHHQGRARRRRPLPPGRPAAASRPRRFHAPTHKTRAHPNTALPHRFAAAGHPPPGGRSPPHRPPPPHPAGPAARRRREPGGRADPRRARASDTSMQISAGRGHCEQAPVHHRPAAPPPPVHTGPTTDHSPAPAPGALPAHSR